MGLFSFFLSKNKNIRSTHEAETFREVFQEDYKVFLKVEGSEDLKRFQELEEYVNSPLFKKRKKEIEQLTYNGSEYWQAERKYKSLLRSKKLRAYYLIRDSQELKGYLKVKTSDLYKEFAKLHTVVSSSSFDRKLHAAEYARYREISREPKISALLRFEKNQKFRFYLELKDSDVPQEFEQLTTYVQSEEFKKNREYLLDKKRYLTTDDYKLFCEYQNLQKRSDIAKYFSLLNDPYFHSMCRWEPVFEDDFNEGKLDENKWISRYYAGERFLNDTYGVGKDVQLFTPENITFDHSAISLNFRKEPIVGKYWDEKLGIKEKEYKYTSAMLSSATSFRQCYGRFEAKVKLDRSALNRCFWMQGMNNVPHINVMKCNSEGVAMGNVCVYRTSVADSTQVLKEIDLSNEYYIFTLEWTKEKLVWMINDTVVKEIHENIPDVPMYVVFSLGANTEPSGRSIPGKMEIDWVKIYKMKN